RSPRVPLIVASTCILLFWVLGVYSPPPSPLNVHETEQLLRGASLVGLIMALTAPHFDLRPRLVVFALSFGVALLLMVQRGIVRMLASPGSSRRRMLIYARQLDRDLFKIVHSISGDKAEFAGLIYDSPWELNGDTSIPWRFLGTWDELEVV